MLYICIINTVVGIFFSVNNRFGAQQTFYIIFLVNISYEIKKSTR